MTKETRHLRLIVAGDEESLLLGLNLKLQRRSRGTAGRSHNHVVS